jgi:hypothetical protein
MDTNYAELLFDGGIDEVRKILVRHIKSRVRHSEHSPVEIDKILGLGEILPKEQVRIPTCEEVLADPQKLTALVLSLFECLELQTSEALGIEWRVEEKMTPVQIHEASECCGGMWGNDEPTNEQRLSAACIAVQMNIITALGNP